MTEPARLGALNRFRRRWAGLTLAHQFLLMGGAVLLVGMFLIGVWVTRQIEEGVTRNTASATALYVDGVIAPLLPDMRDKLVLPEGERRALDETLSRGDLGSRIASFKIWKKDGLISYSNRPELIGKRFEPTDSLNLAWAGQVAAEFDDLNDDEDVLERTEGVPLLEIYSPIREPWSGEVIAVAEFYEIAGELRAELIQTRLRSWLVVAIVTLCMMGLLFGIVRRGSGVITLQRKALEERVTDLSALLSQNEALRIRVQGASSRAVAVNERYLRRISADLHDGPAQLLAFALLRLGNASEATGPALNSGEMDTILTCLNDAMGEIRNICRGLTLPEIDAMDLPQLLRASVNAHEQRTGTTVALRLPTNTPPLSQPQRICIFRFVQEGLTNSFRHAGGVGQSVTAAVSARKLSVVVADEGAGFAKDLRYGDHLGLAGLRERVESLGGEFDVDTSPAGTRLTMTIALAEGGTP